ncbi:MAG: hypothetical protein PHQ75_01960, partial [Thermoguttaceae bacterium]|nr:hypothetical protein [Thermoguttaceae bacterium]
MTTRDTGSPCSDEKSIGFWNARKQVLLRGVTWNDVPESLDSPMVQSLVGRCLLVECLRRQGLFTGWPVYRYGPFGKPQLENYPGLFFVTVHGDFSFPTKGWPCSSYREYSRTNQPRQRYVRKILKNSQR